MYRELLITIALGMGLASLGFGLLGLFYQSLGLYLLRLKRPHAENKRYKLAVFLNKRFVFPSLCVLIVIGSGWIAYFVACWLF